MLTEGWVSTHGFCPACTSPLRQAPANSRILDFLCTSCTAQFELKSRNGNFGPVVPDGAYSAMIETIRSDRQPNLFLMSYGLPFQVREMSVVPRRFLVEQIVIRRKPLSPDARRAGWVGCNINLGLMPKAALIPCFREGIEISREQVRTQWARTAALDQAPAKARGWLAVILGVIERLGKKNFTLTDVYAHEDYLSALFPQNRNIRPKLRQQLQVLRDMKFLRFSGRGKYVLV